MTHKLTIYLNHPGFNSNITTFIDNPDSISKILQSAIDSFYRPKWWKKSKTTVQINGNTTIVIPVNQILCFLIEKS